MPRPGSRKARGLTAFTSQVAMGSSRPFTMIGGWASASKSPRTKAQVSWLMRNVPAGAVCSMRAAMFTAMPRMLPSASTPPPSSTSPVWMPTRMLKPLWSCAVHTSALSVVPSARSAKPQCTARSASSSRAPLAPKAARMLSPAYCSTRPPCSCTRVVPRANASSMTAPGLGVQPLAQRGKADGVEEQNRDLLEDLSRFNGCGQ